LVQGGKKLNEEKRRMNKITMTAGKPGSLQPGIAPIDSSHDSQRIAAGEKKTVDENPENVTVKTGATQGAADQPVTKALTKEFFRLQIDIPLKELERLDRLQDNLCASSRRDLFNIAAVSPKHLPLHFEPHSLLRTLPAWR
jgi:hypothetical protein